MKRSIASVKDLAEFFNVAIKHNASNTVLAGKFVATKVSQVSLFMQTSKGRDKICSLIQYLADLYEQCLKFSNLPHIQALLREKKLTSRKIASRIRESMKNGRKIFKFLKFFDSIHGLTKALTKNKPLLYKLMMLLTHTCNFFYYVIDHLIWSINIGIADQTLSLKIKSKAKAVKDSFSLAKAILKLLKASFDYQLIYTKENELVREILNLPEKRITDDNIAQQSCKSLIRSRAKRRLKQLNFLITILRIIMLFKRLKLPGHNYINKIFYASSGLVITAITIGIELTQHPNLLEVTRKKKEFNNEEVDKRMFRTMSVSFNQSDLKKVKSDLENVLFDDSENDND